ncbi:MAG: hypothetical protein JW727_04140 [Candidatus Aenigmarchaeota archaeon]|nr:hypothetical protein [Candidatus Aenigmarchaeota archaeon]
MARKVYESPFAPALYTKIGEVLKESNGLLPIGREDPVYLWADSLSGNVWGGAFVPSSELRPGMKIENLDWLKNQWIILFAPELSPEDCWKDYISKKYRSLHFNEGLEIVPAYSYAVLTYPSKQASSPSGPLELTWYSGRNDEAVPILRENPGNTCLNEVVDWPEDLRKYNNRVKDHGLGYRGTNEGALKFQRPRRKA